jgi:protein gp37
MAKSAIEWTESTWNPITGCTKVSPGCKYCYAERMALRLRAMGHPNYKKGFQVALHERALELPLMWKKPQMVFVNSMSDIFHDEVPEEFVHRVFDVMGRAWWHTFQLLTKRAERMEMLASTIDWPLNVWMGVSVEARQYLFRIDHVRKLPARVKFISFEPLLEALGTINLSGIDWAIVGGESGPRARPLAKRWVVEIRDQCVVAGVPFFFKQWGGTNKRKAGRLLDGQKWDQMPRLFVRAATGSSQRSPVVLPSSTRRNESRNMSNGTLLIK